MAKFYLIPCWDCGEEFEAGSLNRYYCQKCKDSEQAKQRRKAPLVQFTEKSSVKRKNHVPSNTL